MPDRLFDIADPSHEGGLQRCSENLGDGMHCPQTTQVININAHHEYRHIFIPLE